MTGQRPPWAARIRAERKRRGWNSAEMARRLQVAADPGVRARLPSIETLTRSVDRWEQGQITVLTERYRLLYAKALGFTETELFGTGRNDGDGGAPVPLVRNGPGAAASRVFEALQTATSGDGTDLDAAGGSLPELISYYSHIQPISPSVAVYDDLTSVRSFASSLLGHGDRTRTGSHLGLVAAAGWLSALLAISATDLGDHAAALVWCSDTERRGHDAGHPELLGWAAMTRALIAHYLGQARRSAALARHGQHVTSPGTVVHAKLAAQEMRARAMLGDADGMARARRRAAGAVQSLGPDAATAGVFSVPRAEDPPYTATSLLLVRRYQDAAEATRRVVETVYRPQPGNPDPQPASYARTLLILALAETGLGHIDQAAATGGAALDSGPLVWPTMVLAGKLDHALAESSPNSTHTADYHARYRDATERYPRPAARPGIQ
jgi:transcriptional regulator with XRE-family HTH domain